MNEFIDNLLELFEEKPEVQVTKDTEFKKLPGWDSLVALGLIVMVSNKYNKSIDGDVVRNSETIQQLFDDICA